MKRHHLHYLYIVSWSKEKSTILLKIKRLTQALVLSWMIPAWARSSLALREQGHTFSLGERGVSWCGSHTNRENEETWQEGPLRAAVWGLSGDEDICFERKKWCVALSGQVSRTGVLANKLRQYPACSMTMFSADLSAVEEAQEESRSTVFCGSCSQQHREAAVTVPFLRMKTGNVLDTTLQRVYSCPQKTSVDLPAQMPNLEMTTPWEAWVCLYWLIPEVQFRGKGIEYHQ